MAQSSHLAQGELTDTALHVMLALTQPRHGYAVMQFLSDQSNVRLTLGPASLYTTLKKLREVGFIGSSTATAPAASIALPLEGAAS